MISTKKKALQTLYENKDLIFKDENTVFAGIRKEGKGFTVSVFLNSEEVQREIKPDRFFKSISKDTSIEVKYSKPFEAYAFTQPEVPIRSGLSISNKNLSPGTFSSLIYYKDKPYILGCWHVLAGRNANFGDVIIHPGKGDSADPLEVGTLFWYALTKKLDIAISRPADIDMFSPDSRCFGPLNVQGRILQNLRVKKCGRTTEATYGNIEYTDAIVRVSHNQYPQGSFIFENQIVARIRCDLGDSGALLLDDKNQIIGLLIGGNTEMGFFNKYSEIRSILNKI